MVSTLLRGVAAVALLGGAGAHAEVATDGTMGAKVRLAGRDVTIGADLGTVRGKNLFHSFERFGIQTGGSATFTGPAGLDRVISRVTGGSASSIDGTLRSTIPGADFFFINPAGILFGPNARLDVPASFHASTADELRFPDGGVFSARQPERSVLSVAAPEAFGFLGARPGKITLDQGKLEVGAGKNLSLVGGAIEVTGNGVRETENETFRDGGVLRSPGGDLTLASIGGKGEVSLGSDSAFFDSSMTAAFKFDHIDLAAGALVSSTGSGGGKVRIRGNRFALSERAVVSADNDGAIDAVGGVVVHSETMSVMSGSRVTADVFASGKAGTVTIQTGTLTIDGAGSRFFTGVASNAATSSTADAGPVTIMVDRKLNVRGGAITSGTFGDGNAGSVRVRAGQLTINGSATPEQFTGIASSATPMSKGDAGEVTVTVDGKLKILGNGVVTSSTFASGDAGDVGVTARSLLIDGTSVPEKFTGISSQTRRSSSTGDAGDISVHVQKDVVLLTGGRIASDTDGDGKAGDVHLVARHLKISNEMLFGPTTEISSVVNPEARGSGGQIEVDVRNDIVLLGESAISTSTFGEGNAGSLEIRANNLIIDSSSSFNSTSTRFASGIISIADKFSDGSAGDIKVNLDGRLFLDGNAEISSSTFTRGNAGSVSVTASEIIAKRFSHINSDAGFAADYVGSAGDVMVLVRDSIDLDRSAYISSNSFSGSMSSHAGNVKVQAGRSLELDGTSFVSSSNRGAGVAGNVEILSRNLRVYDSQIGSSSRADRGGTVTVEARGRLAIVDSTVSTNGTLPQGEASVIVLEAPLVIVVGNSRVLALTGDGQPVASAGVVDIRAKRAFISDQSEVRGSSATIIGGIVNSLRTPERLSAEAPSDPSRLLRDCAEERLGGRGSFKATGRGGLPASPEEFLAGRPDTLGAGPVMRLAMAECGPGPTLKRTR